MLFASIWKVLSPNIIQFLGVLVTELSHSQCVDFSWRLCRRSRIDFMVWRTCLPAGGGCGNASLVLTDTEVTVREKEQTRSSVNSISKPIYTYTRTHTHIIYQNLTWLNFFLRRYKREQGLIWAQHQCGMKIYFTFSFKLFMMCNVWWINSPKNYFPENMAWYFLKKQHAVFFHLHRAQQSPLLFQ